MANMHATGGQQDSDAEFEMVDTKLKWPSENASGEERSTPAHFSLAELLFCITLVCCLLGLYIYISPTLVYFLGGIVVYAGVVRCVQTTNPVLGGLIGFSTATVILIVIGSVVKPDSLFVAIALTGSGLGFIFGSAMADLNENS